MNKTYVFAFLISLAPVVLDAQEPTEPAASGEAQTLPGQEAPDNDQQQKEQERAQIAQQISAVEGQARAIEVVQAKTEEFREVVAKEMAKEAPELREEIERQNELVEELTTGKPDDSEREKKLAEFKELRRKLVPIEQRVQNAEPVAKAREAYSSTLIAEMERIDPDIMAKLQRHNELSAALRQTAP